MKTKMYLLGTEIDMTIDGWATIVMDKIDDAEGRSAHHDLSIMAYALLSKLGEHAPRPTDIVPLDPEGYRGADYGDDDEDEDITQPRAMSADLMVSPDTLLMTPAEIQERKDAGAHCQHPNVAFEPDIYKNGVRVSKHHWWCPDCSYIQVG